ncbi:hypothetical protein RDWZM_004757, partial [Blomia tropicalis]
MDLSKLLYLQSQQANLVKHQQQIQQQQTPPPTPPQISHHSQLNQVEVQTTTKASAATAAAVAVTTTTLATSSVIHSPYSVISNGVNKAATTEVVTTSTTTTIPIGIDLSLSNNRRQTNDSAAIEAASTLSNNNINNNNNSTLSSLLGINSVVSLASVTNTTGINRQSLVSCGTIISSPSDVTTTTITTPSSSLSSLKAAAATVENRVESPLQSQQQQQQHQQPQAQHNHPTKLEHVLQRYQQTATMTLNGPDWFTATAASTATRSPSPYHHSNHHPHRATNIVLGSSYHNNNNNQNQHSAATIAEVAAAVLELTKSRPPTLISNDSSSSSTLDLRVSSNSSSTSSFNTKVNIISTTTNTNHTNTSSTTTTINSNVENVGNNPIMSKNQSSMIVTPKDYPLFDPFLTLPRPFPIQQPPLLTPPDQSTCERTKTLVEGEEIACFTVGGEKRLCFPQILNIVLQDFELNEINSVMKELQIYCSTCSHDQMDVLKRFDDIPPGAPSCGLITKTDAHRLCSTLLSSASSPTMMRHTGLMQSTIMEHFNRVPKIKIYHDCFGKCVGYYAPSLYESDSTQCIQCDECLSLFTPSEFVCHYHRNRAKNRTVHWGFDPNNWRAYILPIEDTIDCTSATNTSAATITTNNNKSSSSSPSSSSSYVPACDGGRKAFKSRFKNGTINAMLPNGMNIDSEELELEYYDKTVVSVRKILKSMKCKFEPIRLRTHSTTSSSSTSNHLAKRKLLDN